MIGFQRGAGAENKEQQQQQQQQQQEQEQEQEQQEKHEYQGPGVVRGGRAHLAQCRAAARPIPEEAPAPQKRGMDDEGGGDRGGRGGAQEGGSI